MALVARDITKTYGPSIVLRDVNLTINDGNHIAIVGANGAGKSTLLRILAGREEPDSGRVLRDGPGPIGYLPQTIPEVDGQTLEDLIAESVGHLRRLEARMRELEALMGAEMALDSLEAVLEDYGAVTAEFEKRGGYDLDHRIAEVLTGLELAYLPRAQPVSTLSGGEAARVSLAALLIMDPDLLLLDEPTNHLDVHALEWLEGYLASKQRTILVVSHDRVFLNKFAQSILELDEYTHRVQTYGGDYDFFTAAKAKERQEWEDNYQRQQEEIADLRAALQDTARRIGHGRGPRDSDKYVYNFRGERVQAAISRNVRAAEERLRRIRKNAIPKPPQPLRIDSRIRSAPIRSARVIAAERVSKRYGERSILCDVDLVLSRRFRLAIVGDNGAGKTTLLRMLAGLEVPTEGNVVIANDARIGYLPQEPRLPDPDEPALRAYRQDMPGSEEDFVGDVLRYGLLRHEDIWKRVRHLSIGQRRKLEIARLIALQPNVLLVDEPTNYLSLDVLSAFEGAIREFQGPVVAVSHDRWFLQRFGGQLMLLAGGQLKEIENYPMPEMAADGAAVQP